MSTPAATEKAPVDPYVARLLKMQGRTAESIENILEPEPEKKADDVVIELPQSLTAVGDGIGAPPVVAEETEEQKKARIDKEVADAAAAAEAAKKQETPEQKKARDDKEAADQAAAKTAEAAKVAPPARPVILQKREAQPEKKDEPTEAEQKASEEMGEYIKSLTPEQQDEIEIDRFAESKGKKGLVAERIAYYKKVDEWAKANPEADPNGEEFTKFTKENAPKISPRDRRIMEREMIEDRAEQRAIEAARKETEPTRLRLAEMDLQPTLVKAQDSVLKVLSEELDGKPAIPKAIVDKIITSDHRAAVEEFPVEAPIILGHRNAAMSFLRITSGLEPFDPQNNKTHAWLGNLLAVEAAKMKAKPESETTVNGKKFVAIHEFVAIANKNPADASKYWTFSDEQVIERIAQSGVAGYQKKVADLERSGFVRKTAPAATEVQPKKDEAQASTAGSPKATGHTMTGAGSEAVKQGQADLPSHLRGVVKMAGG